MLAGKYNNILLNVYIIFVETFKQFHLVNKKTEIIFHVFSKILKAMIGIYEGREKVINVGYWPYG